MVTKIRSLGLPSIYGYEVSAECFLSSGLPAFEKVGSKARCINKWFCVATCCCYIKEVDE